VAVARDAELLGGHRPAGALGVLEDLDRPPDPGQVGGGDQPVAAAADDDRVDRPAHGASFSV
jgi:hypothetical protein